MTDMRRVTIPLPDEIDKRILEIKKDDRFIRLSYAEIVRKLLEIGLGAWAEDQGGVKGGETMKLTIKGDQRV